MKTIVKFVQDHPNVKRAAFAAVCVFVYAGAQGEYGPQVAALCALAISQWSLHTRRPQDGAGK